MDAAAQLAPSFWSPQVMAAFISGFIALITAAVLSGITYRQWKTANDKLLMDLFDKRFDNFRTIMGAISAHYDGQPKSRTFEVLMSNLPSLPMEAFYRGVAVSYFLFGTDVAETIRALEKALTALDAALAEPGPPEDDRVAEARDALNRAAIDYIEACEPYMMMGHIAAKGRRRPGSRAQA